MEGALNEGKDILREYYARIRPCLLKKYVKLGVFGWNVLAFPFMLDH